MLEPSIHPEILIADTDAELTQMLSTYLSLDHFNVTVVHDGLIAAEMLTSQIFDLTVMDLMLPGMNGLEILRQYRHISQKPVIILSAHDSETDRVLGLENGADDYLSKPFGPRELKARIQAILRRTTGQLNNTKMLRFGPLSYVASTDSIYWDDQQTALTGAEQRLLKRLMCTPGQCVSRRELARYALGHVQSAYDRCIETHISNIRRKLQLNFQGAPVLLRNLRGWGYILIASQPD
ncbi:response regulator transcription factor [Orrella sp. 11846]|uniref:response regulator transcription factor n=1 Tax=Orrella sp. 11846 TaxID=3409913 RepID=UPI003B5A191B